MSDVESRRQALGALATAPTVDARALSSFLADEDWRVRKDAAALACRYIGEANVRTLLSDAVLQGDDVGLRNAAIEAFSLAPLASHAAVAALLEDALGRALPTARKFVCAALVGGGGFGVPLLLTEALSADAMTAAAAVEALARIDGTAAVEGLRRALAADSQVVRLAALEGLVGRGARLPVEAVSPHLGDPLLRNRALELLGLSGDPGAAALLCRALADARARVSATLGLSRLGRMSDLRSVVFELLPSALDDKTQAALLVLVDGADLERAEAAAHVLLTGRVSSVLAPVARLAARSELAPYTLRELSSYGSRALEPLVESLETLEGSAAAWALEVAAELAVGATPSAVARLRGAVRSALAGSDPQILLAAASAAADWAEASDAARLVELGTHADPRVAAAAGDALRTLARRAPGSVETALVNEPQDALFSWSRGAGALPPKVALAKLKETLSGGDGTARRAAIEALVLFDSEEAAELAGIALADEDPWVRLAAVRTLGQLRADAARPIATTSLAYALRAPDAPVRAAAVRALGALGEVLSDDVLFALARDEAPEVVAATVTLVRVGDEARGRAVLDIVLPSADPEVQKELLRAAVRTHDPRAERWLVERLEHAAWDVRREAATWLARQGPPSAETRAALERRVAVETDDLVIEAARRALGSAGGPAAGSGG